MSAHDDDVRLWLRTADDDWLDIHNNIAAQRVPWRNVAFSAHQAVEKTLKAFLIACGEAPPKTHDLNSLLRRALQHSDLAFLSADCNRLNGLYQLMRYPGGVEFSENEVRQLVSAAERVSAEVRKRIR